MNIRGLNRVACVPAASVPFTHRSMNCPTDDNIQDRNYPTDDDIQEWCRNAPAAGPERDALIERRSTDRAREILEHHNRASAREIASLLLDAAGVEVGP